MGFIAPAIATLGAALSGSLGTASFLTAAAATTAATVGAKSILGGAGSAPKPPAATATAAPAPAPPVAPILPPSGSPIQPVTGGQNKSLAALSPGLALSGTAGFLGSSRNSNGPKTLLGQ